MLRVCVGNDILQLPDMLHTWWAHYYMTNVMEQSPSSEANRSWASQEIPCILCNPNVHYRIHKCPPPVPEPHQSRLLNAVWNSCLEFDTAGLIKWPLCRVHPELFIGAWGPNPKAIYILCLVLRTMLCKSCNCIYIHINIITSSMPHSPNLNHKF